MNKPMKLSNVYATLEAKAYDRPVLPAPANQDKTDCELPPSNTTSDGPPFDTPTTPRIEMPKSTGDIFRHKLGEAVIPVALQQKFISMFPSGVAVRISELSNTDESSKRMRHVFVYDTMDNLKKFEGESS